MAIRLTRRRLSRYPNKEVYYVQAQDGAGRTATLGEVQNVVSTGKWFHNRNSGYDRRKQGPHDTRDDAVHALAAAERSTYAERLQRAKRDFDVIEDALAAPRIVVKEW